MTSAHAPDDEVDPVAIPRLSLVLGFGPMLPILAGGLLAVIDRDVARSPFVAMMILWAAAVLLFIAGVRRGYGFARIATPSIATLAGTFWIFFIGLAALPIMLADFAASVVVLIVGYASVGILDRASSLAGTAPRHFRRLRPMQMAVAIAGLVMLLIASAR